MALSCSVKCPVWCREGQQTNWQGGWYRANSVLFFIRMKTGQASLPTRGDPVVSCFTTFGEFSLWWALSFVIAISQCVNTVLYSQFLSFSLGDGHKGCFSPALPKQPHSSPSASALFWATATGCSPRGQAQAGLGSIWPRALPSDSILGTAVIAGFTYFSLWSASH